VTRRTQSPREKARKAERALGELSLSVTTLADKNRIDLIQTGLRALDDEQADLKAAVDSLLVALETGYTQSEVIEDLKAMAKKWRRHV
jgi:hypothetical protein